MTEKIQLYKIILSPLFLLVVGGYGIIIFLALIKVKTPGTNGSVIPLMVREIRKSSCICKNSVSHWHPCFSIKSKYVLELYY